MIIASYLFSIDCIFINNPSCYPLFLYGKASCQDPRFERRQGVNTLATSKAKEVGSAACIEEIWGSNLGYK